MSAGSCEPMRFPRCFTPLMYGSALVMRCRVMGFAGYRSSPRARPRLRLPCLGLGARLRGDGEPRWTWACSRSVPRASRCGP